MKRVYIAVDKVKQEVIAIFMAENDTAAVRDNLGLLSRVLPLQDLKIYYIADVDSLFERQEDFTVHGNPLTLTLPNLVSLDLYKFPESKVVKYSAGNSPTEDESVDNLAK